MLDLLFELPLAVSGPGIILALCLFAMAGLVFIRRRVLPGWRVRAEDSEFTGAMVQAVRYPTPVRGQLQQGLRDYVSYVIHQAWPLQQRGRVPAGGVELMNRFQATLVACEPVTEGQKLLYAETLRAYNHMMLSRRMRLDAVDTGLPAVLWVVVAAGAVITLSASFFFKVEDIRLHGTLVLLLATFIGLVIFMTLALDRPFRGDLGIRADPYQLIHDQLMKSQPS